MRYIRTKDNIYEREKVIRIVVDGKETCVWHADRDMETIIKIADTIEELCDEFVRAKRTNSAIIDVRRALIKKDTEYLRSKNYEIYGAIWTDKGLIYIAKMNEKGEFELL